MPVPLVNGTHWWTRAGGHIHRGGPGLRLTSTGTNAAEILEPHVNAVDVLDRLPGLGDVLDQDGEGRGEYLDGVVYEYVGGDDRAVESGLFADLAQDCLHGVFVRVDVAARRHLPSELHMLDE
jgi:hypothetical protein